MTFRSASMALIKASAQSEPRGALCSISCQLSAEEIVLLADADAKQKFSAMSAEAIGS